MKSKKSMRRFACRGGASLLWSALLPADAAPEVSGLSRTTNGTTLIHRVTASVMPGVNHRLEASTNLAANAWLAVDGATATGPTLTLSVTNALAADPAQRFFRVVAESTTTAPAGMVLIPAGSFQMGDSFREGDPNELPVRPVFVSAFYLDRSEVSKALWDEVKLWSGKNGYSYDHTGSGQAPNHPVQEVNWYDCVKWCNARSVKEGRVPAYYTDAALTLVYKTGRTAPFVNWAAGYRLPTEAEWEKAARGGAAGRRFSWSDTDTISHERANYQSDSKFYPYDISPTQGHHPAYSGGGSPYTAPVDAFSANGYGVFNMTGNVKEWCWDFGGAYLAGSETDPRGPATGTSRVRRDGTWASAPNQCRVAIRELGAPPGNWSSSVGFRTALP